MARMSGTSKSVAEVLGLSVEQQAEAIELSVKQQGALSTSACIRMAQCITALAAKRSLHCLEKSTLMTSLQIFKSHARNHKGLASMLSFCKVRNFSLQKLLFGVTTFFPS